MKLMSIVGARPEFLQVAPMCWELSGGPYTHLVVHTGQHYDRLLSDVFFEDLKLPAPDIVLGVGSGSHGVQTGRILAALDPVLATEKPDWVIVYGDTNSTLAGALAAAKQHISVAHVEAGLRSFNRIMPEEINRILTDHAADLLFAPTEGAVSQLRSEGLGHRTRLVGDIKTEVTFAMRDAVQGRLAILPADVDPEAPFYVATIHRAENTDDPERLEAIVAGMSAVQHPVVLLAHPRLQARCEAYGIELRQRSIRPTSPLPYPEMVVAILGSVGVITDSGGLQKEAFLLRRPCTTLRTETEWVETVTLGWNILCPDPIALPDVLDRPEPLDTEATPFGTGDTARRIITALEDSYSAMVAENST